MAAASFAVNSFLGGEWCQYAQGRFDEPAYKTALNLCSNAIPVEEGAWVRRPGTQFAGFSRRGVQGRLIGFDVVASTPYDFELTPGFLRVWQGQQIALDQAPVSVTSISAANPAVLTVGSAQTWATGESVQIFLVAGNTNYKAQAYLSGRHFVLTKITTTTFSLADQLGNTLDGAQFALGTTVATAGHIYEAATPWADVATINTVRMAQSEGQILLFGYLTATQLFTIGANLFTSPFTQKTFALQASTFVDGPYRDPASDGSNVQASGTTGSVTLTFSVSQGFTSANIGQNVRLLSEPKLWVSGASYSENDKTKWDGVYYTALKTFSPAVRTPDAAPDSWAISESVAHWCYAVITAVSSTTVVTATLHNIPQPPGPNIVVPQGNPLLYTHDSGNPITTYRMGLYWGTTFPQTGTFHEGRFWFADAVPNRVDSGMANNGLTCSPTFFEGTVADDCGVSAVFNFPESMEIEWMIPAHEGIVCGCRSGEVLIQASQLGDPITPSSIQAHQVSRYGSEKIEPVTAGYSTLFVQRYAKKLLDLTANVFSRRISAANVSLTGRHLTQPGLTEIRYQRELAPLLWALTPNGMGNLIGMTYKREDGYSSSAPLFTAWHRHQLGGSRFPESIASGTVPGGATDTLAMMTSGTDSNFADYHIRHVEFLSPVFQEGESTTCAWQVDDALVPITGFTNSSTSVVFYGYWHLVGRTVSAYIGGLDLGDYTVAADGSITIPFGTYSGIVFNTAFLTSLATSTCNLASVYTTTPGTAPSFLSQPAVQSYLDPDHGITTWTGAASPGQTTIISQYNAGDAFFSSFTFSTGAHVSTQDITSLGVSLGFVGGVVQDSAGKIWVDKDDADNAVGLALLDPATWTVTATWGTGGGSTNLPNNVPYFVSTAYLTLGSTHWLVSGGFVSGTVSVLRADNPNLGFWGHYFNAGGASVSVCAGAQNAAAATAYWTSHPLSSYGSACAFGRTTITAGAETYNPATWPLTNPDMASAVVKTYAPSDIDATWTNITTFSGPAYDQIDGNVIVQVATTDSVTNKQYIVKLRSSDGTVMWKIAIVAATGFDDQANCFSRIARGYYLHQCQTATWGSTAYVIDTSTGIATTHAYTGLSGMNQQVSDDVLGCVMGNGGWDTGHGSLTLLNSTASSGATLVAVYFVTPGSASTTTLYATLPAVIGLNFTSKGQLVRQQTPETSGARNGPAMGKTRRTERAAGYFINGITNSVSFGTDFVTMFAQDLCPNGESRTVLQPFTGIYRLELADDYSFDSMIAWEISRPYPLAIGAIEGFLETSDI